MHCRSAPWTTIGLPLEVRPKHPTLIQSPARRAGERTGRKLQLRSTCGRPQRASSPANRPAVQRASKRNHQHNLDEPMLGQTDSADNCFKPYECEMRPAISAPLGGCRAQYRAVHFAHLHCASQVWQRQVFVGTFLAGPANVFEIISEGRGAYGLTRDVYVRVRELPDVFTKIWIVASFATPRPPPGSSKGVFQWFVFGRILWQLGEVEGASGVLFGTGVTSRV